MKKYNYIKGCALLIGLLITGSCSENIIDYPDPNARNTDTFFNTPAEIEQGAIGIYSSFFHENAYRWQWPEVLDGMANEVEGRPSSAGEGNIQACLRYQHNASTDVFRSYWRLLYRMVMRSNLVIYKAGLYVAANGADEKVSQSLGDAHFLRGWAYSQLAFYWGSVPLRTSFISEAGDNARVPVAEIWAQAESDLKQAQTLLPESWPDVYLGRATKGAATGFLGRLYLYNKKYQEAETEFAKMDGKYSLLPGDKWDDNFGETNENNSESVFEIQFQHYASATDKWYGDPEVGGSKGRNNAHAQLYSWTDWSNWSFQPRRVADFQYNDESGAPVVDPRAALTFYGGPLGDQTYCDNCDSVIAYPFEDVGLWYRKVTNKENKPSENGIETSNNIRLMRYADVLLMRAECQIKKASPDVSAALGLINQVRTRIGAFPYNGTYTADQAFELLKRERQLELMGEQIRYNDLVRWGILKETMNVELQAMFGMSSNVQDKHYLFPIPQLEIDSNPEFGTVANNWN